MKDYEEFVTEFKEKFEGLSEADGITLEHQSFDKVNGVRDAFVVRYDNLGISPVLYTDTLYQNYQDGVSINELAFRTALDMNEAKSKAIEIMDSANEFRKDNIYAAVINTELNQELLKHVPHREIEDLSIIPKYRVNEEATYIIRNEQSRIFNMTPEETLETACWNSIADGYKVVQMGEMIKGMIDTDLGADSVPMYVATNEAGIDGAAAIIDKTWMRELSEELGDNLVVLPSSRHEVIVIPSGVAEDTEFVRNMVSEVNSNVVEQRDFLSNNVYMYDAERDQFKEVGDEKVTSNDAEHDKVSEIEQAVFER